MSSLNKLLKIALLNKRFGIDTRLFQRTANDSREVRVLLPSTISRDFTFTLSATEAPRVISSSLCSNYNVINSNSDCNTLSTETALLNEQLKVSDSHKGVVRLLLDLSEAFDIDRHKHAAYMLLWKHLQHRLLGRRKCLSWFVAYIQHRQYSGSAAREHSGDHQMNCC